MSGFLISCTHTKPSLQYACTILYPLLTHCVKRTGYYRFSILQVAGRTVTTWEEIVITLNCLLGYYNCFSQVERRIYK
jgi:hypothetical protein